MNLIWPHLIKNSLDYCVHVHNTFSSLLELTILLVVTIKTAEVTPL